jgi:hypothetical protein
MKKNFSALLLLAFVSVIIVSCGSKNNNTAGNAGALSSTDSSGVASDSTGLPVLTLETDTHDFGRLNSGELVTYAFKFKNTGESPLLISNVSTSCGCTVTAFPRQPIKPGEESTIDVKFDTTGKHGIQKKMITVFANTEPPATTLRIQAFLEESDDM